jgi:hypothetical protein
MITKHELEASAESQALPRDIAGDWQALKDESVARVPRRGDDGPITLQGVGGMDPLDDGLDGIEGLGPIVPPPLAVPSLTEAAAAARQAAIGTEDQRHVMVAGSEEDDTAVETNTLALAAGEIWADVATSPGDQVGLARDWARGDALSKAVVSGALDLAWPVRSAPPSAAGAPAGVEIPPPLGAAILHGRGADSGLRVTFGRIALGLLVTFAVGFVVGGWWLDNHGRAVGPLAAIAAARTPPPAAAVAPVAPVAPPTAIVAPVVEPIAPAPPREVPAPAHASPAPEASVAAPEEAEASPARPAAHRARGHRPNVVKLDELDLTIPDLPATP